MASPDVRWIQRLENFQRALSTLLRAIGLAQSRPLSELEEQGLIQAFEFTHELSWLLIRDFLVDQGVAGISGSRDAVREAVVRQLLKQQQGIEQVLLYGSRAMGRNHSGSDVDLCLVAPSLNLEDLLLLGARLDDLLLPWRFDLQLQHRIDHPNLLAHIERVGVALL